MAAVYLPYLTDGLRIRFSDDVMRVTVPGHVQDIDDPGSGNPLDRLAAAMGAAGVPVPGTKLLLMGREVFAREYDIGAWSAADAELLITYVEDKASFNGSGSEVEVGSTLEIDTTDFDAENQQKPFDQRTPMYLLWNPAVQGSTVDSDEFRQPVQLPYFAGKPFRRYTKILSNDPGPLSEKFVGATNKSPWKDYPTESVMCVSLVGRNAGEGFRTAFDFSIDRKTLHRGVGRAVDKNGDVVMLTQAQVAAANGIKDFRVQIPQEFAELPI